MSFQWAENLEPTGKRTQAWTYFVTAYVITRLRKASVDELIRMKFLEWSWNCLFVFSQNWNPSTNYSSTKFEQTNLKDTYHTLHSAIRFRIHIPQWQGADKRTHGIKPGKKWRKRSNTIMKINIISLTAAQNGCVSCLFSPSARLWCLPSKVNSDYMLFMSISSFWAGILQWRFSVPNRRCVAWICCIQWSH